MKLQATKLLVALIGCGALLASVPAWADRGHRDHRQDRYNGWSNSDSRGWSDHRGYERREYQRGYKQHRRPVRERVIVREYQYYEPRQPRRYRRSSSYSYSHSPSIVIGVNFPPIVIPLR